MHFRIVAVGRLREPYLIAAAADFRRRLATYHRLEEVDLRSVESDDPGIGMAREGAAVLRLLGPHDHVWLLERTGEEVDSPEVSHRLERLALTGISRLTLVIAGTYGSGPELVARANWLWSLSRLTLLHEWARVLVLEQLYRATKIARNEPYHH